MNFVAHKLLLDARDVMVEARTEIEVLHALLRDAQTIVTDTGLLYGHRYVSDGLMARINVLRANLERMDLEPRK